MGWRKLLSGMRKEGLVLGMMLEEAEEETIGRLFRILCRLPFILTNLNPLLSNQHSRTQLLHPLLAGEHQ